MDIEKDIDIVVRVFNKGRKTIDITYNYKTNINKRGTSFFT